ncbi:hypothetical protein WA158_001889 [Blastocystis sp. Blastoise]
MSGIGEGETLTILVDINPVSWLIRKSNTQQGEVEFNQTIEALLAFMNSFLFSDSYNKVFFITYGNGPSQCIFPMQDNFEESAESYSRQVFVLNNHIKNKIIAGITKKDEKPSSLEQALSLAMCLMNRYHHISKSQRILIFNLSQSPIKNYISFMNTIYCSKIRWVIDVCTVYPTTPFLSQASQLTQGKFVRLQNSIDLYSMLLYSILPNPSIRDQISHHENQYSDCKAPCSCHGRPITKDIAYVCSVCLAIYCEKVDHCDHYNMK